MIVPAPNVAKHPQHQSVRRRGESSRPSPSPNGRCDRQETGSGHVPFPAWSRGSPAHSAVRTSSRPYTPQSVSGDSMPSRTLDPWRRPWCVEFPRPPANASCHARVRLHHRGRWIRRRRPRGASERRHRSPSAAHRGRWTDRSLVDPHAGSAGFELRRRPVELVLPLGAAEASRRSSHLSAARQGARWVIRDQRHGLHPGPIVHVRSVPTIREGGTHLMHTVTVLPFDFGHQAARNRWPEREMDRGIGTIQTAWGVNDSAGRNKRAGLPPWRTLRSKLAPPSWIRLPSSEWRG